MLNTAQPTSFGRPPEGTWWPVMAWISCFSAPWGYRVGRTTSSTSLWFFSLSVRMETAFSLLSSMAMTVRAGRRSWRSSRTPRMARSASVQRRASSAVI